MNLRFIYLFIIIIMISQTAVSQNIIRGKISDKTNNEVLPFANVYLPGLNKGSLSDENGNFLIRDLPSGELKIQFSFIGYKTIFKTIFTHNTDTSLNIKMEPTVMQAEEVVVSGGTFSTQHENAIKIELLKLKDITAIGSPTFTEAIARVPGVDMIAKGVGIAKPVIRGLSMTNILMLNNGVKMENFQFSENHPFLIDEFGIEGLEVIKGPASLLYGSDAVGGVINVIREKPAPNGKIIGDYNVQYHANTQGLVSNLGLKGSSDGFSWGLRSGFKSHGDYRDGNGDFVPNTRFNEKSLKAYLGLSKSFGIFKIYYDYNRPKLGLCIPEAVPLVTESARENKYWYQDLTNQIISSKNTLYLGNYKFDVNVAYQMNNRKLQTDDSKPFFDMVDLDMNTLSYEIKTYLPSGSKSEYIVGLQGANKKVQNFDAPNHILPDADVNDFSVFSLVQYSFWDKLKSQAGIRYDYRNITTHADNNVSAVNTNFGDFSGSLGFTYDLNDYFLLRTNFASAYRTPNIAELTQNGLHGNRYEQGNPELKSQRNYEFDCSTHFHTKYIMIDLSGFYNSISKYIYMSPTQDTTTNGNLIYRYSQTDADIYGSELTANILPASWLNINTSYAYIVGKQADGSSLPFIPQNKIRLEMKYQKKQLSFLNNFFFKIAALYATKQNNPAMFESSTDSYLLFDAGIGADIKIAGQMITLSIQGNNLFNQTYYDHLSTLKAIGYYNIGRNVSFSIKIPFGIN